MSARAAILVERFRQQNTEVIVFTEGLGDEQWRVLVPDEQRTVGLVLHHVAMAYRLHALLVRAMASGSAIPDAYHDWDSIHAMNARHAEEYMQVSRDEVIAALRRYGDRLARLLESLDDEQLQRSQHIGLFGAEATTEDVINRIVLGHPEGHLAGIQEALNQESAPA